MTRTPAEIWTELDGKLSEVNVLQAELNAAVPVEPPVEPPVVPPVVKPPEEDDKRPKNPPAATPQNTRMVPENYPTVMAAYQDAPPGTTISVKAGVECGSLALARNMDPTRPVIIRSRDLLGAFLDQRVRITGKGHWLHGFKETFRVNDTGSAAIVLDADFVWLTRMEIQSPQGISSHQKRRADIKIGWCTFNGKNPGTNSVSNIVFKMPDGNDYPRPSDGPQRIYIYYCDFNDNGSRPGGAMEDHVIYFGDSKPKGNDVVCMEDVEITHCLIRADNNRVRGVYCKRGLIISQCSLLGCKHNGGIRHGGKARIESNIFKGAKLVLNGAGHKLYNNSWESCDAYAGASHNGGGPFYQAADYAEFDMNEGPLNVGFVSSKHNLDNGQGGKVDHVTIWKHDGNIKLVPGNVDVATYIYHDKAKQGVSYLPRKLLTPADVGVGG